MVGVSRRTPSPMYFGWWVVLGAGSLQFFHAAVFGSTFGVYVVALGEAFAWSATALASGFAILQLTGGLLGPLQGVLLDRLGAQRVIGAGVLVFAGGLALLSQVQSLVGYFVAVTVIGAGFAMAGYLSLTTALVPWFERKRATAMAWMAVGSSLGGVVAPAIAALVVGVGWRETLLLSSAVVVVFGLPSVYLLRREPAQMGLEVDGGFRGLPHASPGGVVLPARDPASDFTLKEALRTRAFWMLGLGHSSALLVVAAVIVHLVPHLNVGLGLPLTTAATVVAMLTLMTTVGHVIGGFVGDRIAKRLLVTLAMFAHAGGLLALAWLSPAWGVPLFVVLHGLAWGVRGPLMGALRADYFGASHFGAIMGASALVFTVGNLLGPITAGAMADWLGDYRMGFTLLALLAALGSLAFVLATPPPPKRATPH
jgi:MFS family permease